MAEQTPNEKMVGNADGAGCVEAQERARGTYAPRVTTPTLSPSPQKSTVTPFRGGSK